MTSPGNDESAPQRLVLEGDFLRTWDGAAGVEWLVTNGMGGFASGTLAGANTRRYHALLMAAVDPPCGRTMVVARAAETMTLSGQSIPLSSNQWWDESLSPRGFENLVRFEMENAMPVFHYQVGDHLLEKRVWMEAAENLTWCSYTWPDGAPPVVLSIKFFLGSRGYHEMQHGQSDWHWRSGALPDGFWAQPGDWGQKTIVRASPPGRLAQENIWYWGFLHQIERVRGLDDVEDYWVPGSLEIRLNGGSSFAFLVSAGETERSPSGWKDALNREQQRQSNLVKESGLNASSPELAALIADADAFLVRRPVGGDALPSRGNTLIAGYHWFGDWGRDTMISLPGLTLTTRRFAEARSILSAYAAFVSNGMLPNQLPAFGQEPEYNTVDATLWYFQSIHRYVEASGDRGLVAELFACLQQIIEWHRRGTRHGIHVDPNDGLVWAGGPGVQLTWMDAKVGDWVVTPRTGKPVEISALWYNALRLMADWAPSCGGDSDPYTALAEQARQSFAARYWIPDSHYLHDVIDGPDGDDRSFRPNQLFALSLPYPLVDQQQAREIVDACERRLLTPCGLRSLDPADSRYVGSYGGDQVRRDSGYHQGTVWAWLIGPYVDAVLYAYNDRQRALEAVEPLLEQVRIAGVGSISEIFDGDFPHRPRGCIAQAWSVAEVLRVLQRLQA